MTKIINYTLRHLLRSYWSLGYTGFYLLLGFGLLYLNGDTSKAVLTLTNVVLFLSPLVGFLFGAMHYYDSKQFSLLLLSQPMSRNTIFIGQYLGLCLSLSLSIVVGMSVPILSYGGPFTELLVLILLAVVLTFISVAISYNVALRNDNKIRGLGYTIGIWMLMSIVYDGLIMILLVSFSDYPLERVVLLSSIANPLDLARIMMLILLDVSALMGYTGAVFKQTFGTPIGITAASMSLFLWISLLLLIFKHKLKHKNF